MEPLLVASIFGTALLSGVFGMAGGVLLLIVLTLWMPLGEAMVLHGAAQLVANTARAGLSYRDIKPRVILHFGFGAVLAAGLCALAALQVDTATALIITGCVPLLAPLWKRVRLPSAHTRAGATTCGVSVTVLQLTAGAPGPLLDVFFTASPFNRHEIVATKAVMACLGHLLKVCYFGALLEMGTQSLELPWTAIVLASLAGTWCGRAVLDRVGEAFFRRGTRAVVSALGLISIARGVTAL